MKNLALMVLVLLTLNTNAESVRSSCESGHVITGQSKSHHYKVTLNLNNMSENQLKLIEDIVYGDLFEVVSEKDLNDRTIIEIKEIKGFDKSEYVNELEALKMVSGNKLECL